MNIPFLQAKNYAPANRSSIKWIVIHTMEAPETSGRAMATAEYFAGTNGQTAPQASAHYNVDQNSIVQSVLEKDIAWQVQSKNDVGNDLGIGIEHAGYMAWTAADWSALAAEQMLQVSAQLTADIAKRWSIPITYVDAVGLQSGLSGFTTHQQISNGLNGGVGHQDPGPNFPMQHYLDLVQANLTAPASSAFGWALVGGLALGGAAFLAHERMLVRTPARARRRYA